jgi:hypothetical protein
MSLAAAEPIAFVYAVGLYGVVFVPGAVAALKGHGLWLLLGFIFTPLLWWYAAFRLALPGSWWEENRYGAEKREEAKQRYGAVRAKSWLSGVAALLLAFPVVIAISITLVSR